MNNLYLFQVQDGSNYGDIRQYWLPYSAGCLWAYAKQYPSITENWLLKKLFFKRIPLNELIDQMENPKVCAFSVYMWNHQYSVKAAKAIKEKWPDCLLVFGGPEISASWLKKYKFTDCVVLGEGEVSFTKILNTIIEGKIPDAIVNTERMSSLDDIPSPYVAGIFDDLVKDNPDVYWQAALETNRGCPYACTFCDWGGLTQSKIKKFKLERIIAEIDWMSKNKVKTIFITDANFGIFRERDIEIAKIIRRWIDLDEGLEYISMNYAKNSNETVFEIASILGKINKGITFSVQSMNPDTLKVIKRQNMKSNNTSHLMKLAKEHNLSFYSELMLGLPLETLESWKNGICELMELGQHNTIEILPVMIMENTELNHLQRTMYNLETIRVDGLRVFDHDEVGIKEYADIVKSTSTMTSGDLVEAYLYAWMISNLHMRNYCQLLAKYQRFVNKVPYRAFYDNLFSKLKQNDNSILHYYYNKVRLGMTNIYKYGEPRIDNLYISVMNHDAAFDFYRNIEEVLEITRLSALELAPIEQGIIDIQNRVLFNRYFTAPHTVNTYCDIDTWLPEKCTYKISNTVIDFDLSYTNLYSKVRRDRSSIYNKIEKKYTFETEGVDSKIYSMAV